MNQWNIEDYETILHIVAKMVVTGLSGVVLYMVVGAFLLTPRMIRSSGMGSFMRRMIDLSVPAILYVNRLGKLNSKSKDEELELHDIDDWLSDSLESYESDDSDSDYEDTESLDDIYKCQ